MKQRFHDVEIWKKAWFMELSPQEKCAVFYIKDSCDNVGVWDPNKKLAEFMIGSPVDWDHLLEKVNGNIKILDSGKWWLVDFCSFQYTDLTESSTSPPIKSYVALLKKHGLWEEYQRVSKGYVKGINRVTGLSVTHKDKDKDKDKEKDKDKDKDKDKEKDKDKDKDKDKEKDKDKDILYGEIKNRFETMQPQGRFTNYPKEGKAIHGLLDKARARAPDAPDVFLEGMIRTFEYLRETDKFYKGQPFLPSALNSSGIWDRVLNAAEQRWKAEQAAKVVDVSEVPL